MDWVAYAEAVKDFRTFLQVFLESSIENYIPAKHLQEWARILEQNKRTALLAPRGHLKSTLMYAYLAWRLARTGSKKENWLYVSFNYSMAQMHVRNFKKLIEKSWLFEELYDMTDAEHLARYSWDSRHLHFEVSPAGVLAFKRGWHGTGVIADDILADPANKLNPVIIQKINRVFFEDIIYLPNPEGYLHLVGTPQHHEDLFFMIKERRPDFSWHRYPAILNEKEKKVLWPERWPWEVLEQQRKAHPSSFKKEMMVEPVWDVESYLSREAVLQAVNPELRPMRLGEESKAAIGQANVVAGWDLGKKSHPSHLAVFKEQDGKLIQIYDLWMDKWDYIKQVKRIKEATEYFRIDRAYYDATRGEMETYKEAGELPSQWKGLSFTSKEKHHLATLLEEAINTGKIELINNQRTINQILAVDNELNAYETEEGHGDAFWSIAMAIKAWKDLSKAPSIRIG